MAFGDETEKPHRVPGSDGFAHRSVILTGWKDIARHLGCGIRTAQRWEKHGLPVRRPVPGKRAHVIAHTEQLDSWLQTSALRGPGREQYLAVIERTQQLREEIQQARETLHAKMAALRKEMAALRAKRRHP